MNSSNRFEVEALAGYRQATIERDLRAAALLHEGQEPVEAVRVSPGRRIRRWLVASGLFVIGVISGILLAPIVR